MPAAGGGGLSCQPRYLLLPLCGGKQISSRHARELDTNGGMLVAYMCSMTVIESRQLWLSTQLHSIVRQAWLKATAAQLVISSSTLSLILQLPYYALGTNIAWTGFWSGLLGLSCTLVNLEFTLSQHTADPGYVAKQTSVGVKQVVCISTGMACL